MIDSRNKFSPRFIHMPATSITKAATVAYVRDNSHVYFAWSQVNPLDNYIKSIGRDISKNRLEVQLPTMLVQSEVNQRLIFVLSRVGFISSAELISKCHVRHVISDQMMATMTPMDFKHAYITSIVADIVLENL